ncbi:POTRA domain-containing protein [Tenacibaculum agarivorans]|uniref:POTRA domain-containing protein n=1 Tax=Tenacibaculum agarivorans TaxID=1908389 RepID=UPI00094BC598|nr:POTRA domain-containing protein [Tenacibaculum agarivorans]
MIKKVILLSILVIHVLGFSQEENYIINSITFKGLKRTKASFLKRIIGSKEGEKLNSLQLEEDITTLKRLPAIYHVEITSDKKETSYDLIYNVYESSTILPELAFWTTTNNRFAYKIGVYDYNFLGRNIAIGGFYQNNGYDTYAVNFRAPNLFSKKWGLAVNHLNWKSEEPLFFDNSSANYLYNNISTEVLGLYQLNFNHQFTFGVNVFEENYRYLFGAVSPSVPQNLSVDKILYKFLYNYNDLKYYFHRLEGFKSLLNVEYVTSTNDFQDTFFIAWNDFFYYRRLWSQGNWANRLRIGFSSNNNSPFAPFALDNNLNLRGVGILVDRGTGVVVYNTEYRHTLYDKKWLTIQGNAFIDAGTWRQPGGELNDLFKSENVRIFSGVGLRFINKKIYNAIFRIDYGFSLRDQTRGLVFGIGQYF